MCLMACTTTRIAKPFVQLFSNVSRQVPSFLRSNGPLSNKKKDGRVETIKCVRSGPKALNAKRAR